MSEVIVPEYCSGAFQPLCKWQVMVVRVALAVFAYILATRLINPGFIEWGVPEHSDAWGYFTYSRGSFQAQDLLSPRPLMLLAIRCLGFITSPKAFMLALLMPAILLPYFMLCITEILARRVIGILASFTYFFLCFALATFYELSALDYGGVLAGIFACGYLYTLARLEPVRGFKFTDLSKLAVPLLLMAMSLEFKETYGALMVGLPLLFIGKTGWRQASIQVFLSGCLLVILLAKDIFLASPFIAMGAPATNTYAVASSVGAIVHAAIFYISWVLPMGAWLLVAAAIARLVWMRELAAIITVGALAMLVIAPMLAIPQHLVPMYSWFSSSLVLLLVPLSSSPAQRLGAPRIFGLWQLSLLALAVIAAWSISRDALSYRYWYASNQKANANMLRVLDVLPTMLHAGERVLIVGPLNAYNPFKSDKFIASRFPYTFDWRVAVPKIDLPLIPMSNKTKRLVPGGEVLPGNFDVVLYFDDQSRLLRVGQVGALEDLDAGHRVAAMFCNSWKQIPSAQTMGCLSKLNEYEAVISLSAVGNIPDANAWTWYQVGGAQEHLGNFTAAHAAYLKAASEDSSEVFHEAAKKTWPSSR